MEAARPIRVHSGHSRLIPRTVIAGGGVAGAAAACLLGPDALLIERETAPHDKICGEFLSWEAQAYLGRLGLDLTAMGAAAIGRVRLVHGDRSAEAALPFRAMGLSRRVLDEALLARATALGATLLRGHAMRGFADGALEVDGHGRIPAPHLLLATGKHDLRGLRRTPARPPEELVGLKMYLTLSPVQQDELSGFIEVLLFPGGYAGLQMVEGGRANLCLLLDRDRFATAGRDWEGVAQMLSNDCPHLARRLHGARTLLEQPLSIFRVPYGYVHAAPDMPGVLRLGDQMGVIPSFCGDGVSIALHSAFAAVAAGEDARAYHRQMRRDVTGPIGRAGTLYRLGQAAPGLVTSAARLWPGALRWIARLTRLSPAAVPAP